MCGTFGWVFAIVSTSFEHSSQLRDDCVMGERIFSLKFIGPYKVPSRSSSVGDEVKDAASKVGSLI